MSTTFYIEISITTAEGPKPVGRFNLGHNRKEAISLFKTLKGNPEVDYKDVLYIEFIELVNGLPVNIDILSCSLQELGENSMMITQGIFRLLNLRP